MLCWVNEKEKQALIEANTNRITIDFAESEQHFTNQLNDQVFPVISVNTVNEYIANAVPSVRIYMMFQEVGELPCPAHIYLFHLHKNIFPKSKKRDIYNATELIGLFEGQDIVHRNLFE
jgi:hypothetical protein